MRKRLDPSARRKILNEYSEKLLMKTKDNKLIKSKLEDLRTTLSVNKEMIMKYLQERKNQELNQADNLNTVINTNVISITNTNNISTPSFNSISSLNEENLKLVKKVDELFLSKSEIEKMSYKVQEDIEMLKLGSEDLFRKSNDEITNIISRVHEKNKTIQHLKSEFENILYSKKSDECKDIYVVNPTKANIELNTELLYTKELASKLLIVVKDDKNKNDIVETEIHHLQRELDRLKIVHGISHNKKEIKNEEYKESVEDYSDSEASGSVTNSQRQTHRDLYFPDRVHMKKQSVDFQNLGRVSPPKLDFNKIKARYQSLSEIKLDDPAKASKLNYTQTIPKFTKLMENTTMENPIETSQKNQHEKIEKIKNEIMQCSENIPELREKLDKYIRDFREAKIKTGKLKDNIKIADDKILMLQSQINQFTENREYENLTEGHTDNSHHSVHSGHSIELNLENLEDSD